MKTDDAIREIGDLIRNARGQSALLDTELGVHVSPRQLAAVIGYLRSRQCAAHATLTTCGERGRLIRNARGEAVTGPLQCRTCGEEVPESMARRGSVFCCGSCDRLDRRSRLPVRCFLVNASGDRCVRTHEHAGFCRYEEPSKPTPYPLPRPRYAKPERHRTGTALGAEPLGATAARWLTEISATIDVETATTYALYAGTHWEPHFTTASGVTTESALAYARARLKHVKASTVRKELSALRGFVGWLRGDAAPRIPGVPKRVQGTPDKRAARAFTELSPDETQALIAALRERSAPRFGSWPIRARFVVAYETGLRPATLDALESPKHYTRGAAELTLTPDIDKARAGRPLPLTDRAREALDSVCPDVGVIFGAHDYRPALAEAAEKALPPNRRPTPYDLRRMFCTHLAEVSDNLPGLQFLMGHASASTTAIYIKASKRAALDVLRSTGRLTRPADRQAEGMPRDSDGLAGVLKGGERLPDDER